MFAFCYAALFRWNTWQTDLKLYYFVEVNHFKSMISHFLKTECNVSSLVCYTEHGHTI